MKGLFFIAIRKHSIKEIYIIRSITVCNKELLDQCCQAINSLFLKLFDLSR